jgi:hypothetical protein
MTAHGYGLGVFPQHAELLRASAISPDVARQRNYQSVDTKARLAGIDIPKTHRLVPGLLIPVYGPECRNGEASTWQYRPDHPNVDAKGRPVKYVTAMRGMVVDVPPSIRERIGDPASPLCITEGIRKVDSAITAGIDCLGVLGVWNWRGANSAGGTTALAAWEYIALNGRDVWLCFDSDVMVKDSVRAALKRFTGFLEYRKANIALVMLPDLGDGKTGLDDYLAQGGSIGELEADGRVIEPRELAAWTRRGTDPATPKREPLPPAEPRTLDAVESTFGRWLHDGDPVPTRAVLAAYVANRKLDGDPVWLMLVGGSGVGKTERLTPVSAMPDVIMVSSITGPAALLSGTKDGERARDATGGLLRTVPAEGGVLVLKDFTSIIDMHRESRAEVLAALREIYDGRWDRSIGGEGGRVLSWTGRLGLLAGCTTAIDTAHSVVSTMGTRFVLVRVNGGELDKVAGSAIDHAGGETAMRDELREAVRGLLDHLPGQPHAVDDGARGQLVALGSLVALARSPVDRDQQGEIRLVMDAEAPTRIVKMLAQLWRACGMLGLGRAEAWQTVRRVGLDSVPKLRRAVLDQLSTVDTAPTTTDIAKRVEHPTRTTRRALEDLVAHGVALRVPGGEGKADRWRLSARAADWLSRIDATLPDSSGTPHTSEKTAADEPLSAAKDGSLYSVFSQDDKTGKASSRSDVVADVPLPPAGETVLGPCTRCRKLTPRYGEGGNPLCADCQAVA